MDDDKTQLIKTETTIREKIIGTVIIIFPLFVLFLWCNVLYVEQVYSSIVYFALARVFYILCLISFTYALSIENYLWKMLTISVYCTYGFADVIQLFVGYDGYCVKLFGLFVICWDFYAHLLGGLALALFITNIIRFKRDYIIVISVSIFLFLLWEWMESQFELRLVFDEWVLYNTITDVIADCIGLGIGISLYAIYKRYNVATVIELD